MANRCITTLTVSHPEPFKMMLFMQGIKENNLLSKFLYGKSMKHMKWDVYWGEFALSSDRLIGRGTFCTSYSPPLAAFEEFKRQGFTILAEYSCVEDEYYGSWTDGRHNHHSYSHIEGQRYSFKREAGVGREDDNDSDFEYVLVRSDELKALLNKQAVTQGEF